MERRDKIEMLKKIATGKASIYDLQPFIFIVFKDDKKYISDGFTIGREISETELGLIKCPKIFINENDLAL
jgi:hypothetical protein